MGFVQAKEHSEKSFFFIMYSLNVLVEPWSVPLHIMFFPFSTQSDCGALKSVKNAEVEQFSETDKYIRYRCLDGYKRKAGTSNFAICVFNSTTKKAYWKYGNLSCIRKWHWIFLLKYIETPSINFYLSPFGLLKQNFTLKNDLESLALLLTR